MAQLSCQTSSFLKSMFFYMTKEMKKYLPPFFENDFKSVRLRKILRERPCPYLEFYRLDWLGKV